jgi:hypothetical protein
MNEMIARSTAVGEPAKFPRRNASIGSGAAATASHAGLAYRAAENVATRSDGNGIAPASGSSHSQPRTIASPTIVRSTGIGHRRLTTRGAV